MISYLLFEGLKVVRFPAVKLKFCTPVLNDKPKGVTSQWHYVFNKHEYEKGANTLADGLMCVCQSVGDLSLFLKWVRFARLEE